MDSILEDVLNSIAGAKVTMIPASSTSTTPGNEKLSTTNKYCIHASSNTWSRAARRKVKQALHLSPMFPGSAAIVLLARWLARADDNAPAVLEMQWVRGADRALFESLSGHVGRKTGEAFK